MVVMEHVHGCSWDETTDKPLAELQGAVRSLHEAGFVRADLRSNNTLVVTGTVCIIDFEWAGVAVVYLFFMNHTDVTWPDNTKDGQAIRQAHDLWWVRSLGSQSASFE